MFHSVEYEHSSQKFTQKIYYKKACLSGLVGQTTGLLFTLPALPSGHWGPEFISRPTLQFVGLSLLMTAHIQRFNIFGRQRAPTSILFKSMTAH